MTDSTDTPTDMGGAEYDPNSDTDLRTRIEEALDVLRPYLMADGGSVRLLNVTQEMVVELELLGACGTCPMSTMTLRAGIEQAIKRSVPQVSRVEAVNAPAVY
jgi:Fe-S cluster biogenesis protein NfuA